MAIAVQEAGFESYHFDFQREYMRGKASKCTRTNERFSS